MEEFLLAGLLLTVHIWYNVAVYESMALFGTWLSGAQRSREARERSAIVMYKGMPGVVFMASGMVRERVCFS